MSGLQVERVLCSVCGGTGKQPDPFGVGMSIGPDLKMDCGHCYGQGSHWAGKPVSSVGEEGERGS